MGTTTLIFTGSRNVLLLGILLGGIALVLLGWGVRQLLAGRRRYGLLCVSGALGPAAAVPALLADAVVGFVTGDARRGRLSSLAAGLLAMVGILAAAAMGWLDADPLATVLLAGLGAQVALAVGLFYAAVYARLGTRRISALMALRCAAIAALLGVLFRPAISRVLSPDRDAADKPVLAVCLDRSGSMGRADIPGPAAGGGNERTRHDWAVTQLRQALPAIRQRFTPAWYQFAAAPAPTDTPEALASITPDQPGADQTHIAEALRAVAREQQEADLAAVLLISDGIERPGEPDADAALFRAAERLGAAIYAAGVGTEQAPPPSGSGARIAGAAVQPRIVAQDHVAGVTVRLSLTGLGGVPVEVRLLVADDDAVWTPVDSQFVRTARDRFETEVDLKWTAKPAGNDETVADIRKLRVEARTALTADEPAATAETHALVIRPRVRVLYVEGTMRPEYKYLKRALMTDPNVRLMSLVRVTENRFWATPGDTALTDLPRTNEDFRQFDVLILGDIDRTFFTDDQLARIRAFVNDGGGLMMIGGHHSFGPGGYGQTDVERALPVVCGARNQGQETTGFLPELTAVGSEHPIFDGIEEYFIPPGGEAPLSDVQLPALRGCVRVAGAKSGAEVLAVHPTRRRPDGGQLVVLAVQSYGVGRSAAFTADTTWQWYLRLRARGADSPYNRFWGQLVRWLAGAEAKRLQAGTALLAAVEPSRTTFAPGESIQAHAFIHSAESAPEVTDVRARVIPDEEEAAPAPGPSMSMTADATRYHGRFRAPPPGRYRLRLTAVDAEGNELADDELPLFVPEPPEDRGAAEVRPENLAARHKLLARIVDVARGPDGRSGAYVRLAGGPTGRPDRLAEFVQAIEIPASMRPDERGPRTVTFPGAYDGGILAALFIAFVALMTGEWLLRRSWQLQ
ncbi:MAG: glutamine amidotransferase [Planctomycetota bacterium]